ncbi:MAG: hypothetical protein ACTHXO_01375, partial [Actinomycetaceae bacterium]
GLRYGATWDSEVLRSGTADVTDCHRAFSAALLSHRCDATIEWTDEVAWDPRAVRPAEEPYTVWSVDEISGEQPVVTHRQQRSTRRGSHREVVATPEHPAGASSGWMVLGYAALVVLPGAAGVAAHRLLGAAGLIEPKPSRRSR